MKDTFCDDCIRQILTMVEGQLLEEVVMFDAEKKVFYPVEDENTVLIGDYELKIAYDSGDFKIDIEYFSE